MFVIYGAYFDFNSQACQNYCPALCDSKNNTFSCVRVKEDGIDVKYCEIPEDNVRQL